jgi:hypothetical protein
MKKLSAEDKWMRKVAALYPVAKGSLREVRRNCSRPGCGTCSSGKRHPAWLMTYYLDGIQHSKHVPMEMVKELKKALSNGRKLEDSMILAGLEMLDEHKDK